MTFAKIRYATMLGAMLVAVLVPSVALAQETPTDDDYPVGVSDEEVVDGDVAGDSVDRDDPADESTGPGVAGDDEAQGAVAGAGETDVLSATGAAVTGLFVAAVLAIGVGAWFVRRRRAPS